MANKACEACTFVNDASAARCAVCDTPFAVTGPGQWTCEACTCRNAAAAKMCLTCGTPQDGGFDDSDVVPGPAFGSGSALLGATTSGSGDASWACAACTMSNPQHASRCACCNTMRAGAAQQQGGGRTGAFTIEKLSDAVWKVVEDDRFGQYPFLYVIMGVDKCVVFDTGCDTGASLARSRGR